mgnify:CR=1 FL=1
MESVIRDFCRQQREWLDAELQSEGDGDRMNVLRQLQADEVSVGLYGRTVVRLTCITNEGLLPAHQFTTGDEVEIRDKSDGYRPAGVISEVTESSLSVAIFPSKREGDDDEAFDNPPFSLIPKSSIEVHRKLLAGLDELEAKGTDHPVAGKVVRALFEPVEGLPLPAEQAPLQSFNTNLDSSQREAISFSLSSNLPISLIHGPVRSVSRLCFRESVAHFFIDT